MEEAEAERKAKKRNQLSGIYKYLSLLDGQTKFAYLSDQSSQVISLPPLTNSEITRMSSSTKNVLIEVTSTESSETCKKIMEQLLAEMLLAGIVSSKQSGLCKKLEALSIQGNNDQEQQQQQQSKLRHSLILQQVRVLDSKGTLKSVYPSRVDLASLSSSNKTVVRRLYDEKETNVN